MAMKNDLKSDFCTLLDLIGKHGDIYLIYHMQSINESR